MARHNKIRGGSGGGWKDIGAVTLVDFPEIGGSLIHPSHVKVSSPFFDYAGSWSELNRAELRRAMDKFFQREQQKRNKGKKKKPTGSSFWRVTPLFNCRLHQLPAFQPEPEPAEILPSLTLPKWWTPARRERFSERWEETLQDFYNERARRSAITRKHNTARRAYQRQRVEFDRAQFTYNGGANEDET